MADLLFCSRIHEDGRCNHPVTGERHGEVVPEEHRAPCSVCSQWLLRRDPTDRPDLDIACVEHLDDDEWLAAR